MINPTNTRSYVVKVLEEHVLGEHAQLVSPGILYCDARLEGYTGTQSRLLDVANKMVKAKQIEGRRRGMAQRVGYKLKEKSLEEVSHA